MKILSLNLSVVKFDTCDLKNDWHVIVSANFDVFDQFNAPLQYMIMPNIPYIIQPISVTLGGGGRARGGGGRGGGGVFF